MNMNKTIYTLLLTIRRGIYLSLGSFDRVLGRKNKVFILAYHSVARDNWRFSVDPSLLKKQIGYLWENYNFITLAELEAYVQGKKKITRPSVVLTFDDGYKDILVMKDFLVKHNIRPTLFLLTDTKHANWQELGSKRPFLNKKEIQSLIKAGFKIGSHSATHANLAEVSGFGREVIASKQTLEKELGIAIPYFSYPRGKYTQEVVQAVKKAKYGLAVSMEDGLISSKTNPLLVPRVGIDRTHTFEEFKVTFSPSVVRFRQLVKKTFIGKYL